MRILLPCPTCDEEFEIEANECIDLDCYMATQDHYEADESHRDTIDFMEHMRLCEGLPSTTIH